MKERPIIADNSWTLARLLKRQRQLQKESPHESAKHKAARDYLDKRNLGIKPVRRNSD